MNLDYLLLGAGLGGIAGCFVMWVMRPRITLEKAWQTLAEAYEQGSSLEEIRQDLIEESLRWPGGNSQS